MASISTQDITTQDSPNQGRTKVNSNFSTVVTAINSHDSLIGSLSGAVVDLNSSQTLSYKTLVSNNAGGYNTITIGKDDINSSFFGVKNAYENIVVGNQTTFNIDKTNNTLIISGLGGFEIDSDSVNQTLQLGFPQSARLNHPDGSQTLVVNNDSLTAGYTLDINGHALVRDDMGIGNLSGAPDHKLHLSHGTGGTSSTTAAIETNATSGTSYLYLKRNYNNSDIIGGKYLGVISFGGKDSGTYKSPSASEARIVAEAVTDWSSGDHPTQLNFYTTAETTDTAVKRMSLSHEGFLGLNNSNPETPIHINRSSTIGGLGGTLNNASIKIQNNSVYGYLGANEWHSSSTMLISATNADSVEIATNGSKRLTINSAGSFGFNTSSPQSNFHFVGTETSFTNGASQDEGIFILPDNSEGDNQAGGRIFFKENADDTHGFSLGYNGRNSDGSYLN